MSELAGLGFSHTAAMDALQQCKGNKERALDRLIALGETAWSSAGGTPCLCVLVVQLHICPYTCTLACHECPCMWRP